MRFWRGSPTLAFVVALGLASAAPVTALADDAGVVTDALTTVAEDAATTPVDAAPIASSPDAGSGSTSPTPGSGSPAAEPTVPDTETSAAMLWKAITEKNWFLAAGAILSLLIGVGFPFLKKKWPELNADRLGYVTAAAVSGVTALVLAWTADAPIASSTTALGALKIFAAAVLAFVTKKKLVTPTPNHA